MLLLSVCYLNMMAQERVTTQSDSLTVPRDSVAWNKELGDVTVVAQRQLIKQKIDRIGYEVQADQESKTKTVLDMLRKVPMVAVDGQDNITVKGNSNFRVYRNGHLDPNLTKNAKTVFKSMPASMVKRIEVITDPGAREDAEGVDAILNIVMMDGSKMKGMMGVVNAFYNTLRHPNLYASITGQAGKLLVSADGGYGGMSRKETENRNDVERIFVKTGDVLKTHYDGTKPGHVVFADINASYDIDTLNLLSASFGGYFYKLNVEGDGSACMWAYNSQTPIYSYDHHNWMPGYSHHSWNGRLDYQHKTRRKGEQFTLSYMLALTRQHTDDETTYSNMQQVPFRYSGYLQTTRERFTEHTLQADWLRPLGHGHQLEVGMKYIDRSNNSSNTQEFYGLSGLSTTDFDHVTRVLAGYADYIYQREKWSARAGLRYEYSYMKGAYPDGKNEDFSHHLSDWVPQASVKLQLTEAQSLKLNYTTSINRPGISYLNPAVVVSPTVVQQGNARLKSSHSQTLSLIYMYVGRLLTLQLAPSWQFTNGGIASVESAQGNVRYLTYDNIQRYHRASFEQYVQWRPFSSTTLVVNNNVRYEHHKNPNLGYSNNGWSDNFYFDLSQQLPWKLRFSLGGYGQIGRRPTNVYSVQHSWYGWYTNLQRSFLKEDRLTVSIGANDLFRRERSFVTARVNGDFLDHTTSYNPVRQLNFSLTYRFGSLKAQVKKVDHSIENDDVVGGIVKGK
jgi:hypothetical protein